MEQKQNNTQQYWFVARTRHGMEPGVRRRLDSLGVQNFIPMVTRSRARGKGDAEIPLIPCLVFIRGTRAECIDIARTAGIKADYLIDCATHRMMVVPDKAMDDFRRVFDLSDETGGLADLHLALGERVRVIKGALRGVEGHVAEFQGKTYVIVNLMGFAYARASVPRSWLEAVFIPPFENLPPF